MNIHDTVATGDLYAMEVRAEVLQTVAQASEVRRGQSDRLEIGSGSGDHGSIDTVAGTENLNIGGDLTETVGHSRINTMHDHAIKVHGHQHVDAYQETYLMAGHLNETHHGGEFLAAGMSDDLIGGIGVRTTAPLDLWLTGLIGVEEKLATTANDVVMVDMYAVGMEREFATSIHNMGCGILGGAVYTTLATGFMQLHQIQRGVRNTIPGGVAGGGNTGSSPGGTPPAASPTDGGASGLLGVGRSAGSIDELANAEDLENARRVTRVTEGAGDAGRPNLAATVDDLRTTTQTPDEGGRHADAGGAPLTQRLSNTASVETHDEFVRRLNARPTETLPEIDAPAHLDDSGIHYAEVPADGESLSPTIIAGGNTATTPSPFAPGKATQSSTGDLWADTVLQFMHSTVSHGGGSFAKYREDALNLMAAIKADHALKTVEDDALNLYPHFAGYMDVAQDVLASDQYRLSNKIRHDAFPKEIFLQHLSPSDIREIYRQQGYDFLIRDEYIKAIERARGAGDLDAAASMDEVLRGFDARASAHLEDALDEVHRLQQWQPAALPSHIDQGALQAAVQQEIDLTAEKIHILESPDLAADSHGGIVQRVQDSDMLITVSYRKALAVAQQRLEAGLYPIPYIDELEAYIKAFYPNTEQGYWQLQGIMKARRNLVEWMSRYAPTLVQPLGLEAMTASDGFLDNLASLRQAQARYQDANVPSVVAAQVLERARADVRYLAGQRLTETSHAVGLPFPGFANSAAEARAGFGELHRELLLTGQTDKARQVAVALAELDTVASARIEDALYEARRLSTPLPLPGGVDATTAIEELTEVEQGLRIEASHLDPTDSALERYEYDALHAKADLYAEAYNRVAYGIDPRSDLQGRIRLLTAQGETAEASELQDVLEQVENILRSSQDATDGEIYELPPIGALNLPNASDQAANMSLGRLDLDGPGAIHELLGSPSAIDPSDASQSAQQTQQMLQDALYSLPTGQATRDFPLPAVDGAARTPSAFGNSPATGQFKRSSSLPVIDQAFPVADRASTLGRTGDGGFGRPNPFEALYEKTAVDGFFGGSDADGGYIALRPDGLSEQSRLDGDYGSLNFDARISRDGGYDHLRFGPNAYDPPRPGTDTGGPSGSQSPYLEDDYDELPYWMNPHQGPPRGHTWNPGTKGTSASVAQGAIDNPSHTIPGASTPRSPSYPQPTLDHHRAAWSDPAVGGRDETQGLWRTTPDYANVQHGDAVEDPYAGIAGSYEIPERRYEDLPNSHENPNGLLQGTALDPNRPPAPTPDEDAVTFNDLWATLIHRRELSNPDLPQAPTRSTGHLRVKAHLLVEEAVTDLNNLMLDIYRPYLPEGTSEESLASIGRATAPPATDILPDAYLAANPQSRLTAREEFIKAIRQQVDPDIRKHMRETLENFDRIAERQLERTLEQVDHALGWEGMPLQDHIDSEALKNFSARRHRELSETRQGLEFRSGNTAFPILTQQVQGQQEVFAVANQALKSGLDPTPFVNQAYQQALFKAAHAVDDAAEAQAFADGLTAARGELFDWLGRPTNWSGAPAPDTATGFQPWLEKLDLARPEQAAPGSNRHRAQSIIDGAQEVVREKTRDAYREIIELHGPRFPADMSKQADNLTPLEIRQNLETLQYHLSHAGDLDATLDVHRTISKLDADLSSYLEQRIADAEYVMAQPSQSVAPPAATADPGRPLLASHLQIAPKGSVLELREDGMVKSIRRQVVGNWTAEFGRVNGLPGRSTGGQEEVRSILQSLPPRPGIDDSLPRGSSLPPRPGIDDNSLSLSGDASPYADVGDANPHASDHGYGSVRRHAHQATGVHLDPDDPLTLPANDFATAKGKVTSIRGRVLTDTTDDYAPVKFADHGAAPEPAGPPQGVAPSNPIDLLFADATTLYAANDFTNHGPDNATLRQRIEGHAAITRLETDYDSV